MCSDYGRRMRLAAHPFRACRLLPPLLAVGVALLVLAPSSQAGIVFDGSPGNGAPPATLGGYTMVPSPQDTRGDDSWVYDAPATPTSRFGFSEPMRLGTIGCHDSARTSPWAGGTYVGRVYATDIWFTDSVTIRLPIPSSAVYFYSTPAESFERQVQATAYAGTSSVSSGPVEALVHGCTEATPSGHYFGFYGTDGERIDSITVSQPGGVAVGNFALAGDQVRATLARLHSAVQGVGHRRGLLAKVRAAWRAHARGRDISAYRILGAFIKRVRARTGKAIPAETAARLILLANEVRARLDRA